MYSTAGIDASNYVSSFNTAFYFTAIISLVLLVALTFTMVYFVFRYNRKRNKVASDRDGNTVLEIIWTVVPILLALGMFYYGWKGWKPTTSPPKDAMNIITTARMWSFSFAYENGKQSSEMIVPVNTPVKIKLLSMDVNHSLFIPAFRIKSDIIPGREKMMWFRPDVIGKYEILCAEYCGLRHSYMNSVVKVLSRTDFEAWYNSGPQLPAASGEKIVGAEGLSTMKIQGCFACHSTDGTKIVGPTYLNMFGLVQTVIKDGKEIQMKVDEAFIKQCILDPAYQAVKGYPKGLMQSYRDKLSDKEIADIIIYLKALHD